MGETSYAVDLTAGEILIIRQGLKKLKEDVVMPQWQYELISEAARKMKEAYEKPRMTTEEAEAELEKEKEHWKGMGDTVAFHMVAARKLELRFWNDIEGKGI